MEIKKGIPASGGISFGKALLLDSEEHRIPERQVNAQEVSTEIERFDAAVNDSIHELKKIVNQLHKKTGSEAIPIIEAHIKMLDDAHVKSQISRQIKEHHYSAEYAVSRVLKRYARAFSSNNDDSFLANRVTDIYDVEKRLIRNLLQKKMEEISELKEDVIIISRDLTPTQTASLDKNKVKGFATDMGGQTSHTAIIARALGIPAVVGLNSISLEVSGGDLVVVDGNNGVVIINPDKETVKKYSALEKNLLVLEHKLEEESKHLPAQTKDGQKITIYTNVELPGEVSAALKYGADGIGLFRTEFLYTSPEHLPNEKEHFEIYKKMAGQLDKREFVIRTLDAGGDKVEPSGKAGQENNPFLGYRSIRICLRNPEIFKTQLRGILRASEYGNISIMFPMISSIEELIDAKRILEETKEELINEKVPFNRDIKVGMMVEVPSAAVAADIFTGQVDFFSIGTNDLIQYAIAIDRGNEKVASLYQPAHPAILRLIKYVLDEGKKHNKPVAMCGEMAGDKLFTILLLGLGLKIFSIVPVMIPEIKKIIRSVTYAEARQVAETVMAFDLPEKTIAFLKDYNKKMVPQLFE